MTDGLIDSTKEPESVRDSHSRDRVEGCIWGRPCDTGGRRSDASDRNLGRTMRRFAEGETCLTDFEATFDAYVAWYSWAKTSLGNDAIVCHCAAAAAMRTLASGNDSQAAAIAARAAACDGDALGQTRASYGSNHRYVEWFIWAQAHLGLPDERCHEAVRAAFQAIAAGGTEQSATEAATRLLLPPVLPPAVPGRPQAQPAEATTPGLSAPPSVTQQQRPASTDDEHAQAGDTSRQVRWSATAVGESGGLLIGAFLILWGVAGWPDRIYAIAAGMGVMFVSIQQIARDWWNRRG